MLPPGAAKARKWLLALPKAENTQRDRPEKQLQKCVAVVCCDVTACLYTVLIIALQTRALYCLFTLIFVIHIIGSCTVNVKSPEVNACMVDYRITCSVCTRWAPWKRFTPVAQRLSSPFSPLNPPPKPPPDPFQPPESPVSTPPGHQEGACRSHAC